MKLIMDEVLQTANFPSLMYRDLYQFVTPCTLPKEKYLTVVLHIGIVEVDIKHQNKVLPVIAYLGFRNSHKGSWFVAVDQRRMEGDIVEESAVKAGFKWSNDYWQWNNCDGVDILSEKEALVSFINTLSDEKRLSRAKGVVLITPRYDVSLAILISALTSYNLLKQFLSIVKGVGDMEMLAVSKNIQFKSSGLKAYEDYYKENIEKFEKVLDFTEPQKISKSIFIILEKLLQDKPNYENFHRLYVRPSISPYTYKLLYNSQILELRENYHRITILNQVVLKPGGIEILSVQIKTASKTDIGVEFFVFGYGKLKFGWNKAKLAPNLHLVVTIQNITEEEIILESDQAIGLASTVENFSYPTSLYRKKQIIRQMSEPSQLHGKVYPEIDKHISMHWQKPDFQETKSAPVNINNSLPFADIFQKFNKKVYENNTDICNEKNTVRDPRLQRLKEKQKEKEVVETSVSPEKSTTTEIKNEIPVIPLESKHHAKFNVIDMQLDIQPKKNSDINLDISKDQICQKTLLQVGQEMKAIAIIENTEKRHMSDCNKEIKSDSTTYITKEVKKEKIFENKMVQMLQYKNQTPHMKPENKLEEKLTKKQELFTEMVKTETPKNKDVNNRNEEKVDKKRQVQDVKSSHHRGDLKKKARKEVDGTKEKFGPHEQSDRSKSYKIPKIKEMSASCFDFLSETKPKEKSFKYLSKREELMKGSKSSKEKSGSDSNIVKSKQLIPPQSNDLNLKLKSQQKSNSKQINSNKNDSRNLEKNKKKSKHKSPNHSSADFECRKCKKEFNILKSYKRHLKKEHFAKCLDCDNTFISAEKLASHTKIHHVANKNESNNHDKEQKERTKISQKYSDITLKENKNIAQNDASTEAIVHEKGINICSLCGDSFLTSVELTEHISSPHTSPCFNCDLMFVTVESLKKHKCQNMQISYYSALPAATSILPSLESQPKNKRKRVKVEALSEMATILDAAHLIKIDEHLISQSREHSPTTVQDTPELNKNPKRKLSQEDVICKSCGNQFSNERELFNHNINVHFENWMFESESLNKERTSKYPNGVIDTTPQGPFICKLCGESVKNWNQLLKHLWAPHFFKCEYCDRSYNRNTKLEDHVNKEHDFVGLIDFTKCGLCGEIFGRSSTLARHISSPHNFPCVYCDLKFQSKPILTKHRKNCARFKVIGIIEDCLNSVII